jgi:hypothetical protein
MEGDNRDQTGATNSFVILVKENQNHIFLSNNV